SEVALRQNVWTGTVEQRGFAVIAGLVQRSQRFRRDRRSESLHRAEGALQPLAAARDLEVGDAKARLAEAREEARVVFGEGACFAPRLSRLMRDAYHHVAPACGVPALVQKARDLAGELGHVLELAKPARFPGQQPVALL